MTLNTLDRGQVTAVAHSQCAPVIPLPPAMVLPKPSRLPPGATHLDRGHSPSAALMTLAPVSLLPGGQISCASHTGSAPGNPFADGHLLVENHGKSAVGNHLRSGHTNRAAQHRTAAPKPFASRHSSSADHRPTAAGVPLSRGQRGNDAHVHVAPANPLDAGQGCRDAQQPAARVNTLTNDDGHRLHPVAAQNTTPGGPPMYRLSMPDLGDEPCRDDERASQTSTDGHARAAGALVMPSMGLAGALLDDIEDLRKATANRIGAKERDGLGDTPEVQIARERLAALEAIEHACTLDLQRAMRKHPLGAWVKATKGVGEKQAARLLDAIGDPYWNDADDRARRGPAELWAFCGYVPGQRRQKGMRDNWSAVAKSRAYLIAESAKKSRCPACTAAGKAREETGWAFPPNDCTCPTTHPLRAKYDHERARQLLAVHKEPCVRCGPKGKPAEAGSPLSDSHREARALRVVAKEVLKMMWIQARDYHAEVAS